jgi:hypothetical protein
MFSSSHGSEYEDGYLVGCSEVQTGMSLLTSDIRTGKVIPVYTARRPRRRPSSNATQLLQRAWLLHVTEVDKHFLDEFSTLMCTKAEE